MPKSKSSKSKPSPVEIETIVEGDGATFPKPGDEITCHYVGTLKKDGSEFDSSRSKGKPFHFKLGSGSVIKGWELAFGQLSMGQRAKLTISSGAAYGAAGAVDKEHASGTGVIPPHSDLCFDVELLDINNREATRSKLAAFKAQMLSKFDEGGDLQDKMTDLYGGRAGYEAHLEKMAAAKLTSLGQAKPAANPAAEARAAPTTKTVALPTAEVAAEPVDAVDATAGSMQRAAINSDDAEQPAGLTFDARFASIKVEPNDAEEGRNRNFPRSLHNAAELFAGLGHTESATRLHACTTRLLATLQQGPDGRTTHSMGRACICWGCGNVGLPRNAERCSESGAVPAGECAHCGSAEQTNFVRVLSGSGVVPWMELRASGLGAAAESGGTTDAPAVEVS